MSSKANPLETENLQREVAIVTTTIVPKNTDQKSEVELQPKLANIAEIQPEIPADREAKLLPKYFATLTKMASVPIISVKNLPEMPSYETI
ncbi:MAG: hypothetical protein HC941_22070 [Microcoleus sp. SU_5_3]|nr:hypothetical protein [Microcoleus sp. SU_5_3]